MSNVIRYDPDADERNREIYQQAINDIDEMLAICNQPADPATVAQIEANRRNAKNSTGPKSEQGKRASSRNAIKHGLYSATLLLPEEDRPQYEALCDQYEEEFQPEGLLELNLVETMVASKWKQSRLNLVEQGAYDNARRFLSRQNPKQPAKPTLSDIFLETGRDLNYLAGVVRLQQMESRLKREFSRAAKELRQLQNERKVGQPIVAAAASQAAPAEEDPDPKATKRTQSVPANEGDPAAQTRVSEPKASPTEPQAPATDPRPPATTPPPEVKL